MRYSTAGDEVGQSPAALIPGVQVVDAIRSIDVAIVEIYGEKQVVRSALARDVDAVHTAHSIQSRYLIRVWWIAGAEIDSR